jgi:hypothetical protein
MDKPSKAELVAMLPTRRWKLSSGNSTIVQDQSLEELARLTHARHKKGETPGVVARMEAAFELDLAEIQLLWEHLGLPV